MTEHRAGRTALIHVCWCLPLVTALFFLVRKWASKSRHKRETSMDEPLLTPRITDHRMEAAQSEATRGWKVCSSCGFENFVASHQCAICSHALAKRPASSTRTPAADAASQPQQPPPPLPPPQRRKRPWTRRVDVNGQLFWFREAASDDGSPSLEIVGSTPVRVANGLHDRLQQQCPSRQQLQELVAHSDEPFPTKYASLVTRATALMETSEDRYLQLTIYRGYVFEQSMGHISCLTEPLLHAAMRIKFADENGVDAGGLQREWFMMLNDGAVHPLTGLFVCTNVRDQAYSINPASSTACGSDHLEYFQAVGRFMGRALLEGQSLRFHLAAPVLKVLLDKPLTVDDLAAADPALYQHLVWLLEQDEDVLAQLDLDFTRCDQVGDQMVTTELVPNGAQVTVTMANRAEYVQRQCAHVLFTRVQPQLEALCHGVYDIVPADLLCLFDEVELDYLLCGTDTIDVDDWQRHAESAPNLSGTSTLRWFWEIVREMPIVYRRKLLQFSTGTSRVPLVGFRGLTSHDGRICPFKINGVSYTSTRYFRSRACFNRLDVPLHMSKQEMKTMLYAILDTETYGFTTK
ncbi:TPA: hypothetical protein N0F65_013066 [Lagenidium giganteum]|uniref:HECT-type E3 ubiquitin transferase n=1 Tax=Lagenidium giganteum TaxID=4803 RepID=A0AAV2YHW6_9STRA|nr:TPA: hypothetical protein N0F65_013066 [Lagenidium giganteum]